MGRRIVVPRREVPYCCEKSCTKANGKEVGTQILRKDDPDSIMSDSNNITLHDKQKSVGKMQLLLLLLLLA